MSRVAYERVTHRLWARVTLATALVLAVEAASLVVIFAISDYAGRERPGDADFQSLGRAILAFLIGASVGIALAVGAAAGAARITACRRPVIAGLSTIATQLAVPIGLAAVRAPHPTIMIATLVAVPAMLWLFARSLPRGPHELA